MTCHRLRTVSILLGGNMGLLDGKVALISMVQVVVLDVLMRFCSQRIGAKRCRE